MQNYTEISEDEGILSSLPLILANDKTALSCSSGDNFPTENVQVGQLCFKTNEGKLYITPNGSDWRELVDISNTQLIDGEKTFVKKVVISDATASGGVDSGALIVAGGLGVAGEIFAPKFNGEVAGNSASASKLAVEQGITVGATPKTFDGSAPIAWTIDEILPVPGEGAPPTPILKHNGQNWVLAADNDTTYAPMTADDFATATPVDDPRTVSPKFFNDRVTAMTPLFGVGVNGFVPATTAPAEGETPPPSFLCGDGTWSYPVGTTYAPMTADDFATATPVDDPRTVSPKFFNERVTAMTPLFGVGVNGFVPATTAPTEGETPPPSFLCGDGTWAVPVGTTYAPFTADDLATETPVDDPRTISPKVFREQVTAATPLFGVGVNGFVPATTAPAEGETPPPSFLCNDGTWAVPVGTTYGALVAEEVVAETPVDDPRTVSPKVIKDVVGLLRPPLAAFTADANGLVPCPSPPAPPRDGETPAPLRHLCEDGTWTNLHESLLPLEGGVLTGRLTAYSPSSTWISGSSGATSSINFGQATADMWHAWGQQLTSDGGGLAIGAFQGQFCVSIVSKESIDTNANTSVQPLSVDLNGISVVGKVISTDGTRTLADDRLKIDIQDVEGALAKVKGMKGVAFVRKDNQQRSVGFLTESVKRTLPEAVEKFEVSNELKKFIDEDHALFTSDSSILAIAVEAIKELSEKVDSQSELIKKQSAQIQNLQGKS